MMAHFYKLYSKATLVLTSFFFLLSTNTSAEGTKEFRPDSAYFGNMQVNDMGRPFALESNSDPLYRLYFHIKDYTTEKVYIGFNHILSGSETGTYRIKNPNGVVVKSRANIPSSGTGYIKYYSQAVAGPKISTLPANGYTPIVFTPAMNGDFYIEFTTSYQGTNTAYHFDLFDLTVATSTANRIKGRLWSYCWDLNTRSYTNRYWGKFYSYSDDAYVTEFNMNGIQPFGFTVSCNNSGPTPSDRKSVDGNSTRPQYKVFLNDPDVLCYPSGITPVIVENLALVDTPFTGQPALFTIKMSKSGTVEMVIELNGIPGYQPNTEDVILVQTVAENVKDTITWDGKDGLGVQVNSNQLCVSSADFYTGITHFPLYDPETNDQGYIVNRIRPVAGPCKIYWDDSNFPGGTTNVTGQYGPAHTWPYFFGDVRTMNSWWDGFRIDTMATFEWSFKDIEMPIELYSFTAKVVDEKVELYWATASETNNNYFEIERNTDGTEWIKVCEVAGAGTTNQLKEYYSNDNNPVPGSSLYRLKQVDYDGKFSYSDPVYVNINQKELSYSVYPNPINSNNAEINILEAKKGATEVIVYSEKGQIVYTKTYCKDYNCVLKLNFDEYTNGIYVLYVKSGDKEFKTKIVKTD
jgi:hypothetical protein